MPAATHVIFAGTASGLRYTKNQGSSWLTGGATTPLSSATALAFFWNRALSAGQSNADFFVGVSSMTTNIFRSSDSGENWINKSPANTSPMMAVTQFAQSCMWNSLGQPYTPTAMYVATHSSPMKSGNNGDNWYTMPNATWNLFDGGFSKKIDAIAETEIITTGGPWAHSIPVFASKVYGVDYTRDKGTLSGNTITDRPNNYPGGVAVASLLMVDRYVNYGGASGFIYAGTLSKGVYKSTGAGNDYGFHPARAGSWEAANNGMSSSLGTTNPGPINALYFYKWPSMSALTGYAATATTNGSYSGVWFATSDSGNNRIWRSTNGTNWAIASGGMTTAQFPATPTHIFHLEDKIYVGTQDAGIFYTSDTGDNWTSYSPALSSGKIYSLGGYLWYASRLLTLSVIQSGSVSSDPPGDAHAVGTVVGLSAYPSPGYSFSAWVGDVSSFTGSLVSTAVTLTIDTDKSITAIFDPLPYYSGFHVYESETGVNYAHQLYFNDCEFEDSGVPLHPELPAFMMKTLGSTNKFTNCKFIGDTYSRPRKPNQTAVFESCDFINGAVTGYGSSGVGAFYEYQNCTFDNYQIATTATSAPGVFISTHKIMNSLIKNPSDFYSGAGARLVIENSTIAAITSANAQIFLLDNASQTLKMTNCMVENGYLKTTGLLATPDIRLVNVVWKNAGNTCMTGSPLTPMLGNFTADCQLGTVSAASSFNVNVGVPI